MTELTALMRHALMTAQVPSAVDLSDPRLTFTTSDPRPGHPSQGSTFLAHLADDCPVSYDPPADQGDSHAAWRLCQHCARELNGSFTDMCRIATGLPLLARLENVSAELGLGTFAAISRAKGWISSAMLAAGILRSTMYTGMLDRPFDDRNSAWVAAARSTTGAAIGSARSRFADAYERRFAVRAQEPRSHRAVFVPRATWALLSDSDSPGSELVAYEWLAFSPEDGWVVVALPEVIRAQRPRAMNFWQDATDLGAPDLDTADTWLAFTAIYNDGAVTVQDAISAARGVNCPSALATR